MVRVLGHTGWHCPRLTPAGSSALHSPHSLPCPEQGEPLIMKQMCNTIDHSWNKERGNKTQTSDCPPASGCSASPQAEISPSQPTPPVSVLSRMFWALEYPCAQFRSALLALLPPSSLCSCSLAELKHQPVTTIISCRIQNTAPDHLLERKWTVSQAKPGHPGKS